MKNLAVIINTCNRPFLLRNLVDSLKPQLADNDAIIIVNDGDLGSVQEFAREGILTIDHCKDYYALASGRNKGMETAISVGYDWGLFLDDDIEVSENLIENHKNAWNDKKTAYAGKITEPGSEEDARKKWWNGKGDFIVKWGGCNVSCHLPSLKEVGGYNEDFDGAWGGEDNELYYRLTEDYGWNIDYLENAEIENLKAPTSGKYNRYSEENLKHLPPEATYKAQVQSVSVGDKKIKFYVETEEEQERLSSYFGEKKFIQSIINNVKDEDTYWDVGACIGVHTCLIASLVQDVVSFEPELANYKRLNENIGLNDFSNVETRQIALGHDNFRAGLNLDGDQIGNGRHSINEQGDEIKVRTGDSQVGVVPDIVKIDVEGAEGLVLHGMSDILSRNGCREIYLELHTEEIKDYGFSKGEIKSLLEGYGYEGKLLDEVNDREFWVWS